MLLLSLRSNLHLTSMLSTVIPTETESCTTMTLMLSILALMLLMSLVTMLLATEEAKRSERDFLVA